MRPALFDLLFIVDSPYYPLIIPLLLSPRNLCFLILDCILELVLGDVSKVLRCFSLGILGCADGAGSDISSTEPGMAWLRH